MSNAIEIAPRETPIAKIDSLDGWELVDALDGRRWLGHVVSRTPLSPSRMSLWAEMPPELQAMVLATGHEHVTLDPAFELLRQTSGIVMVEAQNMLGRNRSTPAPQWMHSPPRIMVGVAQLPCLPSYTTVRCGGFPLADLPAAIQRGLVETINESITAIARARKDAERGS